MWYTPGHTLTHNAIINMVIGPRGAGKTFGLKDYAIKKFLKNGKKFIYLRRYDVELKKVQVNLFNDLNIERGYDIEWDKDIAGYRINGQICGYAMALSKAAYYKSASFPDVDLIIYDEFIVDTRGFQNYLRNEVDTFLNFYETVARMRDDVKAFLLANSLSFINPYTIYWNLKKSDKSITKAENGLVLLEIWNDSEYAETKAKTKFGQLVAGTEFGNMAVDNEFILDSDDFICPKDPESYYYIGVILSGREYSLWSYYGIIYCQKGYDPSAAKITFNIDDHNEDTILMKGSGAMQTFIRAFKNGKVRFEDMFVKAEFMELFRRICR